MKLHAGRTFWNHTDVYRLGSTELRRGIDNGADVVVVGGGMSGALTAYALCDAGLSVILIDRAFPGLGSTAANTGLLQYPSDMSLHESIDAHGREDAKLFYRASYEGLQEIKRLASRLPGKAGLVERDSLCFASRRRDAKLVKAEVNALKRSGFQAAYVSGRKLKKRYGIDKPNAFITKNDSQINPYQFVRGLLRLTLDKHAFRVYHETEYLSQTYVPGKNYILVRTSKGLLYCNYVVLATGYARDIGSAAIEKKIERVQSFAIISEPIPESAFWQDKVMLWETARPYIYIRHVEGDRILVGGLDDKIGNAPGDRKVKKKAKQLEKKFHDLFPRIPLKTDYAYGGIFGETKDGMPFIGRHPSLERTFCLYGYGGNGTVYSSIGALLLKDLITGRENAYSQIFALDKARLRR